MLRATATTCDQLGARFITGSDHIATHYNAMSLEDAPRSVAVQHSISEPQDSRAGPASKPEVDTETDDSLDISELANGPPTPEQSKEAHPRRASEASSTPTSPTAGSIPEGQQFWVPDTHDNPPQTGPCESSRLLVCPAHGHITCTFCLLWFVTALPHKCQRSMSVAHMHPGLTS